MLTLNITPTIMGNFSPTNTFLATEKLLILNFIKDSNFEFYITCTKLCTLVHIRRGSVMITYKFEMFGEFIKVS